MGKIGKVTAFVIFIVFGIFYLSLSSKLFIKGGWGYIGALATGIIGLLCIGFIGYKVGAGKPVEDEMLPENEEFKVKKIIDNDVAGGTIEIILRPALGKNVYYLLKVKHFEHSPRELKEGDIIKNIYGKYQVFPKPSS